MPATAPFRVVPRQKIPNTITGTKAEAASEKEADTMVRISEGLSAATKAADKATVPIFQCFLTCLRFDENHGAPGNERAATLTTAFPTDWHNW